MKLKSHKNCKECPSCMEMPGSPGHFYCNMKFSKVNEIVNAHTAIIDCKVDPESKLEDCPWDETAKVIDTLSYEDKLGIRCISKMFGGGTDIFFEEEPPCFICGSSDKPLDDFELTLTLNGVSGKIEANFCPLCGRKLRKETNQNGNDRTLTFMNPKKGDQ